jgi:hypothetical protein
MIQTIGQRLFIDAFRNMGREKQFSYAALCALFEWLEENDENYDLDVIALCCEFTEYADLDEFNDAYNNNDTANNFSIADIESCTTLIPVGRTESFLVQNF